MRSARRSQRWAFLSRTRLPETAAAVCFGRMGIVHSPPVHSVGFGRLDGCPVALVVQDEFVASYLQAALEHHGAVVMNLRGTLEDISAVLRGATPRPMVAA